MTRINSAIPVAELTDEHILAEHREIKRLPAIYAHHLATPKKGSILAEFVLGKGHVLFFVEKPAFTLNRYLKIFNECNKRGFAVTFYGGNWTKAYTPEQFRSEASNHTPTEKERGMLLERITQRIFESPKKSWHYYGVAITKQEAIGILNNNKNERR